MAAHGIDLTQPETAADTKQPREYSPADAEKIVAECSWFRHCRDDAAELPEGEWFAEVGILSKCENGEALAHEFSAPHPEYDENATQEKFERASEYGPILCASVEEKFGWGGCATCPHRGKIKSPIVLGCKRIIKLLDAADAEPIVAAALAALRGASPDAKALFQNRTLDAVAALNEENRSQFMIDLKTTLSGNKFLRSIFSIQDFKTQVKRAQTRRATEQARQERDEAVAKSGLPPIKVINRALRDVSDDALRCMIETNIPPRYFVQAQELVSVAWNQSKNGDRLEINQHTQATLKRLLSRIADFDYQDNTGMLSPPDPVVTDILRSKEWDGIPLLNGISSIPILRPDGAIFSEPGFDPVSGIYYSPPAGFELPEIPENPTNEDLKAAVRIIYETFREFPFTGPSDWAHVLGYLLTLLLRFNINGHIPGFAANANRPGVGKTRIFELGSIIVLGWDADLIPPTADDEEWRKKITAELKKGSPQAVFDNLMGRLNSPALAAVVVSRSFCDRILGVTSAPRLPNNTVWALTGNKLSLGSDLVRRFIPINLFWPGENPEQTRKFIHKDIKKYARENRPQLFAALLTIARAWYARGCPLAPDQLILGSFEQWSETIGGMLHVAGVLGFLKNLNEPQAHRDGDSEQWARLLRVLFSVFFDSAFEVASIVNLTQENVHGGNAKGAALHEAIPEFIFKKLNRSLTQLGQYIGNALSRIEKTIYSGLSIEKAGVNKTTHSTVWRVHVHDEKVLPEHTQSAYRLLMQLRKFNVNCNPIPIVGHLSDALHSHKTTERIATFKPFPAQPTMADGETTAQWLSLVPIDSKKATELCRQICGDNESTEKPSGGN